MLSLSAAATLEKYKLAGTQPWYLLIEIFPTKLDLTQVLRLARNTDDIVFKGNTFIAFNFDIDLIENKASAQLPTVQARVSNINRIVESYLNTYDGGVGATVNIYLVSGTNLLGEPDLSTTFTVMNTSADAEWCSFQLGADNPLRTQIPKFMYVGNYCQHLFNTPTMQQNLDERGLQCAYVGSLTSCDKTLDGDNGCRAHGNQGNFGGVPGVDVQGFRGAQIT